MVRRGMACSKGPQVRVKPAAAESTVNLSIWAPALPGELTRCPEGGRTVPVVNNATSVTIKSKNLKCNNRRCSIRVNKFKEAASESLFQICGAFEIERRFPSV